MKKLYVLIGVPGSGKTTWIKNQEWSTGCAIVSTDDIVEEYAKSIGSTYNEVFDDYMPTAVKIMAEKVVEARNAGKDIIWDQTSTTVKSRKRKFNMLPDYYAIAVIFPTPPSSELRKRLDSRPGKNIPWSVVSQMASQLESNPPTEEEGFKEIWRT